jgi:predicted Zn finger-like uncharacterized protein
MAKFVRVICPSCSKDIYMDPSEVPESGKSVICSSCGTTFKVKLGKKDKQPDENRGIDFSTRPRVVVIEDSKFARTQIVEALGEEGITVVEAETAEDGLKIVRELQPSVVIVDIFLGIGNPQGLDIIRTIKKGSPEDIKVVMYTVMSEEKVPLAVRKMTDSFVHKGPTALFHLREEVIRLLKR